MTARVRARLHSRIGLPLSLLLLALVFPDATGVRATCFASILQEKFFELLPHKANGSKHCPPCNASNCPSSCVVPSYVCLAGAAAGGCSKSSKTFRNPNVCTSCCGTVGCAIPCGPCSPSICAKAPCSLSSPALCLAGDAAGACGSNTTWENNVACSQCCDLSLCSGDGPGPQPPSPTPQACLPCNCSSQALVCPQEDPFLCTAGVSAGGCGKGSTWNNSHSGCAACCDLSSCFPAPPTPRPASPWDNVPPSQNCTLNGTPVLAPDPAATPWGGADVSQLGCRASVSQSCCGYTPRFNWILSTCHHQAANRVSMACKHEWGNTSALKVYYVKAYQWNGSNWLLDPTSSVSASERGGFVNFTDMFVGGGANQDWDLKYAPTTANQGSNGVGPPGMMFVLSVHRFAWSAFYLLNQITLNRGPGGEIVADNCWGSSSGELDILEPAFWAGVSLPPHRLYTTVTADSGRCFPVEKSVPPLFNKFCNADQCCEMCSCPAGLICFGNISNVGFSPMGCIPRSQRQNIPNGSFIFTLQGNETLCSEFFGGVSGGQSSTAYFDQGTTSGLGDVIYRAIVDRNGMSVTRLPAFEEDEDETGTSEMLRRAAPGIRRLDADDVLPPHDLGAIPFSPPCREPLAACGLFEPGCPGECPLVNAAGVFGIYQQSGEYAAESARDGLNWWDAFAETTSLESLSPFSLPLWVNVSHFVTPPPPPPFYCNSSCSLQECRLPTRCPVTAPYMCTGGDGSNGCSQSSTFWPFSGHCSSCCDVRLCDQTPCTACTMEQCNASNACATSAPFMCTAGPDAGGCSAKSQFWPADPSCWSCCSVATCSPS